MNPIVDDVRSRGDAAVKELVLHIVAVIAFVFVISFFPPFHSRPNFLQCLPKTLYRENSFISSAQLS